MSPTSSLVERRLNPMMTSDRHRDLGYVD